MGRPRDVSQDPGSRDLWCQVDCTGLLLSWWVWKCPTKISFATGKTQISPSYYYFTTLRWHYNCTHCHSFSYSLESHSAPQYAAIVTKYRWEVQLVVIHHFLRQGSVHWDWEASAGTKGLRCGARCFPQSGRWGGQLQDQLSTPGQSDNPGGGDCRERERIWK